MDTVLASYGFLLALGGTIGFVKKNSIPSLLAGGGSGLFFVYAAQDVHANRFPARLMAAVLCLVMSVRAKNAGKFMPAGMVALLSGGVLAYLLNLRT